MKIFSTILIFALFIIMSAKATTVNCTGGKCDFNYSNLYKSAKTDCSEYLSFEKVEINYLYFTIIRTGKKCQIYSGVKKE